MVRRTMTPGVAKTSLPMTQTVAMGFLDMQAIRAAASDCRNRDQFSHRKWGESLLAQLGGLRHRYEGADVPICSLKDRNKSRKPRTHVWQNAIRPAPDDIFISHNQHFAEPKPLRARPD